MELTRTTCEKILSDQVTGLKIIESLIEEGLKPVADIIIDIFCHQDIRSGSDCVFDMIQLRRRRNIATVPRICLIERTKYNQEILKSVENMVRWGRDLSLFHGSFKFHEEIKIEDTKENNIILRIIEQPFDKRDIFPTSSFIDGKHW